MCHPVYVRTVCSVRCTVLAVREHDCDGISRRKRVFFFPDRLVQFPPCQLPLRMSRQRRWGIHCCAELVRCPPGKGWVRLIFDAVLAAHGLQTCVLHFEREQESARGRTTNDWRALLIIMALLSRPRTNPKLNLVSSYLFHLPFFSWHKTFSFTVGLIISNSRLPISGAADDGDVGSVGGPSGLCGPQVKPWPSYYEKPQE